MGQHKPGGGIASRQHKEIGYRQGTPNRAVRPGAAGQIGTSVGSHATNKKEELPYRGVALFGGPAIASKLGNEIAPATVCGPGGSRTVYKSGGQSGLTTRQNPKGRSFDV
jgi:hypothetical protein